jgi:hypothetical protein
MRMRRRSADHGRRRSIDSRVPLDHHHVHDSNYAQAFGSS